MCGEDGRQRVVYKLKEEHAKRGGSEQKRKRKKNIDKEKEQKERKQNCTDYQRKTIVVPTFKLSVYVKANLFIIQKLTQFFTPTLYKSYYLGLFTCEPNTITVRCKSRPYIYI